MNTELVVDIQQGYETDQVATQPIQLAQQANWAAIAPTLFHLTSSAA